MELGGLVDGITTMRWPTKAFVLAHFAGFLVHAEQGLECVLY